jgi:hypothetical protein
LKEKATRFTIYEAVKINAIDETLKEFIKQWWKYQFQKIL